MNDYKYNHQTEKGGAQMLTCDRDTLYMYTFNDCEDCQSCSGQYYTYDYSAVSDDCFKIACTEGTRKKQVCEARGLKAKANKILQDDYQYKYGINAVEEYYGIDALELIGSHITNHQLFVEELIAKHEPSIIQHKMKNSINKKAIHKIFGHDNIFQSPVLYIIGGILICMVCIAGIVWRVNRKGYEKVLDHDIHA